MSAFKDRSIKFKLTIIIMSTTILALVVLTAMELSRQEKEQLSKHVSRIAHKASTSWTFLISELSRIVSSEPAKKPSKNNCSAEAASAAVHYCTTEMLGQDWDSG